MIDRLNGLLLKIKKVHVLKKMSSIQWLYSVCEIKSNTSYCITIKLDKCTKNYLDNMVL